MYCETQKWSPEVNATSPIKPEMIMLMPLWIITFEIRRHFTPAKKTIYKMENPYKKQEFYLKPPNTK
jgi:hypothetical protein